MELCWDGIVSTIYNVKHYFQKENHMFLPTLFAYSICLYQITPSSATNNPCNYHSIICKIFTYLSNVKQIYSYIMITERMVHNCMFCNIPLVVFQESWNWADCRGEKRSIAQRPLSADWTPISPSITILLDTIIYMYMHMHIQNPVVCKNKKKIMENHRMNNHL